MCGLLKGFFDDCADASREADVAEIRCSRFVNDHLASIRPGIVFELTSGFRIEFPNNPVYYQYIICQEAFMPTIASHSTFSLYFLSEPLNLSTGYFSAFNASLLSAAR